MRLVTYFARGGAPAQAGFVFGTESAIHPAAAYGLPAEMNALIPALTPEKIAELGALPRQGAPVPIESAKLLAPIPHPKQDVICLGVNYWAHEKESARFAHRAADEKREWAVYFSKRVNEAVPDGGAIPSHADLVDSLDYEAELAVVLYRDAAHLDRENALGCVLGYTILNDVSARNVQSVHKQWYFGKSLDGFCPMGPWIVTADEFTGVPDLRIQCRVNGELRQDARTGQMIHSLPKVLAELSAAMTLQAGTVISTGTPNGVGMGCEPPRWLHPGDVVACSIEGIGTLTNTVV